MSVESGESSISDVESIEAPKKVKKPENNQKSVNSNRQVKLATKTQGAIE